MSDVFNLRLSQLNSLIQQHDLTAEYVLSQYLERIKKINRDLNAIISLAPTNELLSQAREIDKLNDKERKEANLLGIPIAIKDLEDTKGIKTTYGSKIFSDYIPEIDGPTAKKLRMSGSIFVGKTNTPEFGIGSHTFNSIFGVTRNPYNSNLSAGGSSGGAAVAVATSMLPIADGSDMMGSLRNPAAFNNIYGFRPTIGLINDKQDNVEEPYRLSTTGPMAKKPEDLGYLLQILINPDNATKQILDIRQQSKIIKSISCKNIKIGWLADLTDQYYFEDGILQLCQECLKTLAYCGSQVSSIKSNIRAQELWQSWTTLRSLSLRQSLGTMFDLEEKKHLLKSEIIWEINNCKKIGTIEKENAINIQNNLRKIVEELFLDNDFLALPSTSVFPFNVDLRYPTEINGNVLDTYHRWMEVVTLVSLLGLPCVSLPCGLNSQGLPTGLQIIGRPFSDIEILSLAQTYSKTTNNDKINPIS